MQKNKSTTQAQLAYGLIRDKILSCQLLPATKLNISAMAAQYEVSLGAVREALSMLQSEFLTDFEPQRGYRVSAISRKDLIEITTARIAIESLCLSSSIQKGDLNWETNIVAALHRLSHTFEREPANKRRLSDNWAQCHSAFHLSLVSACDNQWLLKMRYSLYEQSERYRRYSIPLAESQRDILFEHKQMADAVLARNTPEATSLLSDHLNATTNILLRSNSLDLG